MPRRCNGCYSYASKQRGTWWLIRLCIGFTVVVILGGIVFSILRAISPLQVKAEIDDARLSNFSMAPANTTRTGATTAPPSLAYNISIALTVRNPNPSPAGVRYTKPLMATFVFHDRLLRNITVIDQGTWHPMLKDKLRLRHADGMVLPYVLDAGAAKDLEKQNATGIFKLEVRLSGEIAFLGLERIGKKRELALSCSLSLQLAPPGPAVVLFRKVRCKHQEPQKFYL